MEAQRRVWWVRYEDFLFFIVSLTLFTLLFLVWTFRMEETKTKRVSVTERQRIRIPRAGITYIPLLLRRTVLARSRGVSASSTAQYETAVPGTMGPGWPCMGLSFSSQPTRERANVFVPEP